jgi:dTDP-4-dehydrorhamnose 3,5-epimerase
MIEGVRIKQLKVMPDERGRLMEILRCDDPEFVGFGQVYMTTVYPGVVKAWHYHRKQIDNMTVVKGVMKLALYDDRADSTTRGEVNEFFISEHRPVLVQIPRGVLHGIKGVGTEEAVVINLVTEPYNREEPDEHRVEPHSPEIPYNWALKEG